MRLAQPITRIVASVCVTFAFAALLILPNYNAGAAVQARPLQQGGLAFTVDDDSKFTDAGQRVTYTFTVTNNSGTQQTFTINVSSTFPTDLSSNQFTLGNGQTTTFIVGVRPSPDEEPGTSDTATVTIDSTTTDLGGSLTIVTTVTVNGRTPTPTAPATITPTPTGTVGPTATSGPVCQDEFEPDGSLSQAQEIRPDQAQGRAICPRGDEDFAYFGGIAGKVYTIDVETMASGLDLSLSLYDEVGNLLAFNDDFPRDNNAGDIRPRIQSFRVPANGRYYIKARDNAGRGATNLTYTLELQSESYGPTPTLVAELCSDLFEPDGVPEQARLITVREIQPNHKLCPAGDADWVRFFAKTGQTFVIRTDSSRTAAGADPVMILVDRDGASILDLNDDSNNTLDARIEFTPIVDGFYYAQIKNVGDIGNQFIAYDFIYEPLGVAAPQPTQQPTSEGETATPTVEGDGTTTPTITGTPGTETPTIEGDETPTSTGTSNGYNDLNRVKGGPALVNGATKEFVDPALKQVWSRTDQVVAEHKVDRSWMWGPAGLQARAEVYTQSNGGARQVQYFDKARMEITNWSRDRANPWFVTNGLLVKELIEGRLQIGDSEYVGRTPAAVPVAGDADDQQGPTYASFAKHLAAAGDRTGQTASASLSRDGVIGKAAERTEAKLAHFVPETGHNVPQVFWDFLQARGPIGNGQQTDVLVDWVFALGYPISEPYWTKVKVGGVEKDVLVQAFQRRVLTYTPTNPAGWQVEMGNVGRHYYQWRYGRQP